MSNIKSKTSSRLLATILSLVMVFSVFPIASLTASAATDEAQKAVTITVKDEDGNPIKGAEVSFVIDSVINGDAYKEDKKTTNENGVVEVMAEKDFVDGDFKVSATVTAEGFADGKLEKSDIKNADDDFEVALTSTKIKGVEITGKTLTYIKGTAQELVSVTKIDGDTVLYELDGGAATSEIPKAENVGTYNVRVTVQRAGKDDLVKEVTATIGAADITDVDIAAKAELKYNGTEQELVELVGLKDGDNVTWSVNGTNEASQDVPKRMAVGNYEVKLTVDRGANYNTFEKTVNVNIALGEIDLGKDLTITANELTYNAKDQKAVKIRGVGDYILSYQFADDEKKLASDGWKKIEKEDDEPTVKDAGTYTLWIKAVKDNYKDKETEAYPISVTVAKADQTFRFEDYANGETTTEETLDVPKYLDKTYSFKAIDDANLANGSITYSVELSEDDAEIAEIDSKTGVLTVYYPGEIKVVATLSGNDNYNECVIEHTLAITTIGKQGEYVKFAKKSVEDYIFGTNNGTVSENKAENAVDRDSGKITYSIKNDDNDNYGLSVDREGKVTISDYAKLDEALRGSKDGTLTVTVEAAKAAVKYLFGTKIKYPADSATYIVNIKYLPTPQKPYEIKEKANENGWYKTASTVTPKAGYKIAQTLGEKSADVFSDSVEFNDQGINDRYVYLKDENTGAITNRIKVVDGDNNLKIDTVAPETENMKIDIQELNIIEKLCLNFGFYNPSVVIKFIVADETGTEESGMDHIKWFYEKESTATSSILEEKSGSLDVTLEDGKYVATLTLPATEAEQYRGHIAFEAYDKAGNGSERVTDEDVVIVVDTLNPRMTAEFQVADAENGVYVKYAVDGVNRHYFNGPVDFTFTIKEANFFSDDVTIKVTKDGKQLEAKDVPIVWSEDGKDDETHYGKLTLKDDGDYVVSLSYKDQSENVMIDDATGDVITEYKSEVITIDTTPPEVNISYVREKDKSGDDVQKTVFTVTEHNFRASDVVITGTMKDINATDVAFTAVQLTEILNNATWTRNGDTYTYEYDQYVNGIYNLKMDYKDISGWDATQFVANEFIIDHGAPTEPTVEYITTPLDTFLSVITFGYYNPSVTVRFTSYDAASGVESFTWGYTKQNGASSINHPEALADATVAAVQDQTDKSKFTAEITLTADQAAQYRGYISVLATDTFKNKSVKKVDDGNIIVVDTIAPKISVEYTEADRAIGQEYFYNNAVDVKFTVTEANFYAEDVAVTVTKNGEAFNYGSVAWGTRNAEDEVIGTFTLPAPADHSGDGHYVITVEYTDRSNNEMVKYVSDTHTIDTTKPVINVEYQNKTIANKLTDRDGNERNYFADTQTAIVTITEHNFIADEVDFTIVAKDVTGDATALNTKSEWKVDSTGDVHTITITYPGDANYTFDVAYTDKATNAADDYAPDYFTVDKTAPANLKVNYSTSVLDTVLESLTFGFYNAKMTVTLSAEDPTSEVHSFLYSYLNAASVSNVNAELINEAIKAAAIEYSEDRKTATVTFEIPKMVLGNDNQFNGTVEFTATDRSGNETDVHKETKRIVVDNIAPTAQVTYNEATNTVGNVSYYNGNISATVTVTEANFYKDDVQVMVSKDGGAPTRITPTWKDSSVDVHVGTFTLTEDGDYIVAVNYTDKSSNKMKPYTSNQMTIDTKIEAPTYSINGVAKNEIGGAYKGDATVSFNFADQNFDSNDISLTRTRFDKVEDVTAEFIGVNKNAKGGSGSFSVPAEVGNDGIYVLKISMTDRANHQTESQVKFTINRFGSVYEYSDELVNLIKNGGQYVTAVNDDLVITEYNADRINEGSLKILVTRDGETADVDFTSNPRVINSQVGVGESGWYQYVYTIKASTFEKDGVYKISLTSAYDTDDVNDNESTSVPENSVTSTGDKILDTMNFTVDSVAPEIRNIVNLEKAIADVDKITDGKLNVKYTIVDVGGLKSIEIILNGKTVQTIGKDELGSELYNYTGSFDISEQDGTTAQKVRIKVTDLAGNVTDTDSSDFLKAHSEDNEDSTYIFHNEITVSRNFFVRWYANTALFWGSIIGVAVLAGAVCVLIVSKKKKKEDN